MKNSILCLCTASLLAGTGAALNVTAAEAPPTTPTAAPAQVAPPAPTPSPAPAPALPPPTALTNDLLRPLYWPFTVGVEAGSTGFGLYGSWRFADHVGARLGADYFEYSTSGTELKDVHWDTKTRLLSEVLTADFYPWKKHSYKVSVGMLFNQNQLTADAVDSRVITLGGETFPVDQVGNLHLKMKQWPVNPYLSIGGNILYFDHAHHWALAAELGLVYTGDPTVTLDRYGPSRRVIDEAVRREQAQLQDYANQFTLYPVFKLAVNFSF